MIPLPALTFDADTHRYRLHGRELIGVTEAIKAAGLIEGRFFTEATTLRGSHVHTALEYLDGDDLAEHTVDPSLLGYLDAYRAFLREVDLGPVLLNEARLCDPVLSYAGTVDRARTINGRHAVIDIKTGGPSAWHGVQLAGYAALVRPVLGWPLAARYGLYLRPDGTYTLTPYTHRSDWDVFRACLLIAQFQRTHCR